MDWCCQRFCHVFVGALERVLCNIRRSLPIYIIIFELYIAVRIINIKKWCLKTSYQKSDSLCLTRSRYSSMAKLPDQQRLQRSSRTKGGG